MNARGQVNVLAAIVNRLPAPRWAGEWTVSHGQRFEVVNTPDGLAWRTVATLDFPGKKNP